MPARLKNFSLKNLLANTMVRWWIVGLTFTGLNLPLLYFADLFIEQFHLSEGLADFIPSFLYSFFTSINSKITKQIIAKWLANFAASLVASEIANIVRFFVNDRWVFGFTRPTWKRFWQYHIAIAGGQVVWLGAYNFLINTWSIDKFWGIDKVIICGLIATSISVFVNMLTNFLWIWRKKKS